MRSTRYKRLLTAFVAVALTAGAVACGGAPVSNDDAPSSTPTTTSASPKSGGAKGAPDVEPTQGPIGSLEANQAPSGAFSEQRQGQPTSAETIKYATDAITYADRVWSAWFINMGKTEPWVNYQLITADKPFTSYCKDRQTRQRLVVNSTYPNAFYCNYDPGVDVGGVDITETTPQAQRGALLLPIDTLAQMWTGKVLNAQVSDPKVVGDYAAGAIIFHEWGHHIAAELAAAFGVAEPVAPNAELISDCFSGITTRSLLSDNFLEKGDLEEALNGLAAIADDAPGGEHGQPADRINAFNIGYYGSQANPTPGRPATCIQAFWPALAPAMGLPAQ